MSTVEEAHAEMFEHLRNGSGGRECPVCTKHCESYKRHMNSALTTFLGWLVESWLREGRWYHIKEGPIIQGRPSGGDYAKLQHWRMIEGKPLDDDPTKTHSGLWRPTFPGVQFVAGRLRVPAYYIEYKNELWWWADELTSFEQAHGRRFDMRDVRFA